MPSIFDRLRNLLPAKKAQTDISLSGLKGLNSNPFGSTASTYELYKLLNKCGDEATISGKDWALVARAMYDRIPLVKRAVRIHRDMLGNVYLPEDTPVSERTRSMVEDVIGMLPIVSESIPDQAGQFGINELASRLLKDCFIEGMAFAEERFTTYEGEVSEDYLGVMLFDPENWRYQLAGRADRLTLTYVDGQQPFYNNEGRVYNPYFHTLKLESDHIDPWGMPIVRGGLLIFRVFVSLLICIDLQAKRFGNPPTLTVLSAAKESDALQKGLTQDQFKEVLSKTKADIQDAYKLTHQGNSADVVGLSPFTIDVMHKTLGADLKDWLPDEILWKVAILACDVLEVPPALMNVNDTGGGMNSDMFTQHYKLLSARAASNRRAVLPVLNRIVSNYLLNEGVPPSEVERVSLAFDEVDLHDPETQSKIAETNAKTKAVVIDNYEALKNIDDAKAEAYAIENGLK